MVCAVKVVTSTTFWFPQMFLHVVSLYFLISFLVCFHHIADNDICIIFGCYTIISKCHCVTAIAKGLTFSDWYYTVQHLQLLMLFWGSSKHVLLCLVDTFFSNLTQEWSVCLELLLLCVECHSILTSICGTQRSHQRRQLSSYYQSRIHFL